MLTDLRYAFRQLLKAPGFAAVAILTLALGIGANTAIFSVTNAVLLRALPYKDPDRIVSINKIENQFGLGGLTAGAFLDFREQSTAFEHLAAYDEDEFTLTGNGDPERVVCSGVSSALFPLLGVKPSLGRTFSPEEEQVGRDQVVVVSESFWRRRTGGDPNFVGQTITLNDKVYTVIGVMPAQFQFPRKFEIWKPLALDPEEERHGKQFTLIHMLGRLKAGVPQEQADAELNTIATRRPSDEPGVSSHARIEVTPLHEQLVKDVRLVIFVLLGAVGLVLLIACANVANLMLARAAVRRKEIAIRAALGAGRGRIIAQLLTESVLLSLLGGALGLLLAVWGVDLLVVSIPVDVAGSFYGIGDIGIDWSVLIFTLLVSVATGIFFGLAPALSSAKLDLNEALKATAKVATARSGLRGAFVVSQLALTLVLLIGAGLMTRSFVRLTNVKLGFNSKNVLTMRVELPRSRYENGAHRKQFFEQLLERVKSIPGIQSAGAISQLPLSGYSMLGRFAIEGQPKPEPGKGKPMPIGIVTPAYFQTMQIPLVQGRLFDARDIEKMPEVAIVNEAMARRFWPGENPIGRKVAALCDEDQALCRTVVGVVGDIRHEGLANEAQPEIYVAHQQVALPGMSLVLRTTGDPLTLVSAVRLAVRALDKDQPVALVQTLDEHVSQSILQPRLLMTLLSIFAALALILAAVGVYAMMSYSVSQRRSEIGIRIALGALKVDILRLVVGQAALLVAIGLTTGGAGALMATRLLRSLLYEIDIWDPFTFAAIAALLAFVAVFAAWLPARRAAKISPMIALRTE